MAVKHDLATDLVLVQGKYNTYGPLMRYNAEQLLLQLASSTHHEIKIVNYTKETNA